jgi:Zn-dependent peptidase ImmA (M78 family)
VTLAKSKARQILKELRIENPELLRCLKEICVERGAFVKEQDLNDAEARLVVSGDRGIITVQPDEAYPGRTRFSIAHELGHFELHRGNEALWACSTRDMNNWTQQQDKDRENREHEANQFAAELLMPEDFIKPEFARNEPALGHLKELASRYQMSLSAMAFRYAELTDHACAVVFSRAGAITHSLKSTLFDRQKYWIPQGRLSAYSHAYNAHAGKTIPTAMTPVEAGAWFQVPPYLQNQTIMEHSEYYKGIDLGITLLWIQPGRLIRTK